MTLKKIDYSKLVVYKIVCKDLSITDLYVGSTTNFDQRKKQHKNRCYNQNSEKYHYLLYQTIRKYGGFENWSMIIIEKCPCDDSYNARKIERFYYEQLNGNLNTIKPFSSEEEKQIYNIEQHKKSYEKNKDILNQRKKEKIICICGSVTNRGHKTRHEKTFKHISHTQPLFKPTDESNA